MTGRRPFSELIKDWPPERRRRVEEGTARLSAEVEAAMAAERAGKRTPRGGPPTSEMPGDEGDRIAS